MYFQEMGFSFPRHQNPFSGSRRSLGSQVSNQPPMVFDPPRPYSPPSLYHTLYLHLYHLYHTLRSLYLHLYVWRQINGPPVNPPKFPTSVPSHTLHSPNLAASWNFLREEGAAGTLVSSRQMGRRWDQVGHPWDLPTQVSNHTLFWPSLPSIYIDHYRHDTSMGWV